MATETHRDDNNVRETLHDFTTAEGRASLRDRAAEKATHYKDVAVDRSRSALHAIEKLIQDHPWAIVGGALAAGAVLGMLLRRR